MHRKGIMQTLFLLVVLSMAAGFYPTGHVHSADVRISLSEGPSSEDSYGFDGDLDPFLGEASAPTDNAAFEDYLVYEHYGGNWSDAEKAWKLPRYSDMCWAAAASNVLEWTGWGLVENMTTTDDIFDHILAHFDPLGGFPSVAWNWWFNGTGDKSYDQYWNAHNVTGGGGFWTPPYNWSNFWRAEYGPEISLQQIDEYLSSGCGVVLGIRKCPPVEYGHAITCWGFRYDPSVDKTTNPRDYYKGIWVTDSDDDKKHDCGNGPGMGPARDAPNNIYYLDVSWINDCSHWHYGTRDAPAPHYIRYVWGFERLLHVPIDIKPGSDPNSINPRSNGLVSVAILNDASWTPYYINPALVDPSSVVFGPNEASPVKWFYEDVDLDGDIDLILFFNTRQTGITDGDTSAILTANLTDEGQITGFDNIWTTPRKKK